MTGQDRKQNFSIPGSLPEIVGNELNERFISVANDISPLDVSQLPAYLPSGAPPPSVSPQDVFQKLKKLNLSKSGGPDCIPPRINKEFAYELCFPLAEIFNCSLQEGRLPNIWKSAYVVPVPKSNTPSLDNVRPISLTCIFSI